MVERCERESDVHAGTAQPQGEGRLVDHDLDAAIARLQLQPDALSKGRAIGRVGHGESLPQSARYSVVTARRMSTREARIAGKMAATMPKRPAATA